MSRIGRLPILLPKEVRCDISDGVITVSGPKGMLTQPVVEGVTLRRDGDHIHCERSGDGSRLRARHGLMRALLANMVRGVTQGFEKRLEVQGLGYRVSLSGATLNLSLGFSHPVAYLPPQGIELAVERTTIVVRGIDKQRVGQVAADIRAKRPPEPYKGKGIRYSDEVVRRKAGKAGK
ncbi:MAG: 50S ribosomal protein L6 [Candidatus Tectomicrobia bacterium]|nr:50S ribosomal protein L6 [Candidatus Tectomicrobia bacterium]